MTPDYATDINGERVNRLKAEFTAIINAHHAALDASSGTNLEHILTHHEILCALEVVRACVLADAVLLERENRER